LPPAGPRSCAPGISTPDFIRADRACEKVDKPQDAAVKALVEREFPGFGLIE